MEFPSDARSMLDAIFALAGLTLFMASWQGLTRLPAMKKAGLDLQDAAHASDLDAHLPSKVRRINDNYNHLMEAPTVFYAVALAIIVGGLADTAHLYCAWMYVGLRCVHSLTQATVNLVAIRAPVYTVSWLVLGVMIVRAVIW